MTEHEIQFLRSLKQDGSVTGNWLLPSASRESDKARTKLKRKGFAAFDRNAWAWRITAAGRAALSEERAGE